MGAASSQPLCLTVAALGQCSNEVSVSLHPAMQPAVLQGCSQKLQISATLQEQQWSSQAISLLAAQHSCACVLCTRMHGTPPLSRGSRRSLPAGWLPLSCSGAAPLSEAAEAELFSSPGHCTRTGACSTQTSMLWWRSPWRIRCTRPLSGDPTAAQALNTQPCLGAGVHLRARLQLAAAAASAPAHGSRLPAAQLHGAHILAGVKPGSRRLPGRRLCR